MTLTGLDISHWQPYLNWDKAVRLGNVKFMFAKCTDVVLSTGKDYKDDKFFKHVADARKAGVITGSYHFFQPAFSASQQARAYFNQASKAKPDLPPVIDLERSGGKSNSIVKANVLAFCEKTKELWGRYPIIYSRDGLIKQFDLQDYIKDSNLYWKASYVNKLAGYPCKFWQFTEKLRIPGIACDLDGDRWMGTDQEFNDFVSHITPPDETSVPIPIPTPTPMSVFEHIKIIVNWLCQCIVKIFKKE